MDLATITSAAGLALGKLGGVAAGAPIKAALRWIGEGRPDAVLGRVYAEIVEEIALELPANLWRLEERFAAEGRNLRAELAGKIDERAATVLFVKLLGEAMESAERERTRMLCAGMAGVFNPDLGLEMKSRVARSVVELEPSDLLRLREIATSDEAPNGFRVWRIPGRDPYWARDRIDDLAGCVSTDEAHFIGVNDHEPARIRVRVRQLGRNVLAFLETYRPEVAPASSPSPGSSPGAAGSPAA